MRPTPIVRFELIASIVVVMGFLSSCWVTWGMMTYGPSTYSTSPTLIFTVLFAGILAAIQFLLISFVSRRGSVIAKWIYIVFTSYSILALCVSLYLAVKSMNDINTSLNKSTLVVQILLIQAIIVGFQTIAAYQLFRKESLDWFDGITEKEELFDPTVVLLIGIGGVICFFLFVFVSHVSGFGTDCYYIGSLSQSTSCINPAVYRLAWMAGLAFLAWGIADEIWRQKVLKRASDEDWS